MGDEHCHNWICTRFRFRVHAKSFSGVPSPISWVVSFRMKVALCVGDRTGVYESRVRVNTAKILLVFLVDN